MKGLIMFGLGLTAGFCIACYALDEKPSYAFGRLINNI